VQAPGAGGGLTIRRLLTLPNILTLLRLASAPLFLVLFFADFLDPIGYRWRLVLCLAVVILSETSDLLDGWLARRYKQVSDFGKLMDPYADSAFRLTVLFSFASHEYSKTTSWVPLWMVVLLLYRDLVTSVLRTFAIKRGAVVAARFSGKLKAVAEAAAIISVLVVAIVYKMKSDVPEELKANIPESWVYQHVRVIMWIVLAIALWSAADYFWACRGHMAPPEDEPAAGNASEAPPKETGRSA
jgi:CDP-diacylglycerol--glycerol-3-phosphate 3-phosphatidyltransferase